MTAHPVCRVGKAKRAHHRVGTALRAFAHPTVLLLAFCATAAAEIPLDQRRSGYADVGRDTKAMQDDDTANPGMLWVLDGEAQWNAKAGTTNRSCADCHGARGRRPSRLARLCRASTSG